MSRVLTFMYLQISYLYIQGDTKKRELLKNPTKIEEIKKKLTEIETLQIAFQETVIQIINV